MKSGKGGTVAAVLGVLVIIACIVAGFYFGGKTVFTKKNAVEAMNVKKLEWVKGKWVTGDIEACSNEFYIVDHKMNGLIPTGKEHYYIVFMTTGECFVIRANNRWYEKNFDIDTFLPKNGDSVKLEGYVRRIDSKFAREIQDVVSQVSYGYKPTYYIDTLAMRYGIFLMILAGLPILLVIFIFLVNKVEVLQTSLDSTAGKVFIIVGIILFFAYAGLMMHTLAMI